MNLDETLTPLKVQSSFQVAEDGDGESTLTKIPHGLTAKRNRRKSYQLERAYNDTDFAHSPVRVPLTAPRLNVLNARPIGTLEMTKRSLMSQLNSMRSTEGKENNGTPLTAKALSPVTLKEMDLSRYSSPGKLYQKRRSSTVDDISDETVLKMQKINDLLADAEAEADAEAQALEKNLDDDILLIDTTKDVVEDGADEELSRIEIGMQDENVEQMDSSFVEQDDFVQIGLENCNEEIIKNNTLSDITNTAFDKLPAQKLKLTENITAFEAIPISPHKKHHALASPNKKPYFTISQVHEIQSDFKNEVEALKKSLQGKSSLVLNLNEEIGHLKNEVYQLEDNVKSLNLEHKGICTENKLLKAEHGIFKENIGTLEQTIEQKDGKIERSQMVIAKFKERVQELNAIITAKELAVEEAQSEMQSKSRAIEILNQRVLDFENHSKDLNIKLHHCEQELNNSLESNTTLKSRIAELEAEIAEKEDEYERFASSVEETIRKPFESAKAEVESLKSQLNSEELELKESQTQYSNLTERIKSLETELNLLNASMAEERHQFELRFLELTTIIGEKDKALNLQTVINDGLQRAVNTLKSSYTLHKSELEMKTSRLALLEDEVNESKDLLIVKTAEVEELSLELKECAKTMKENNNVFQEIGSQNTNLEERVQELTDSLSKKEQQLTDLRHQVQKAETDHITELEAFHSELSNLQSLVTNKNNEIHKLNDANDKLQKKNEFLSYEHQVTKEEIADYDTRLSTLKAKLNEYKEHASNLENLVQSVEEEKAQLERDTDQRLQQLAEDLYIQYSKKHEQKVQVLKKGYENKWQTKVSKAESETERLRSEVEGLKAQLEQEKLEKNEIIKLWDNFKAQEKVE